MTTVKYCTSQSILRAETRVQSGKLPISRMNLFGCALLIVQIKTFCGAITGHYSSLGPDNVMLPKIRAK